MQLQVLKGRYRHECNAYPYSTNNGCLIFHSFKAFIVATSQICCVAFGRSLTWHVRLKIQKYLYDITNGKGGFKNRCY